MILITDNQILNSQYIVLVVFAFMMFSTIVVKLLIKQWRLLKENREVKQKLNKTKEELQNMVKPEVIKKELSRQLHLIIMANRIQEYADDIKKEWSSLVYKIKNEKYSMFEASVIAIERVYPDMYAVIRHKYSDLNDTESKVLLLSCSDLTNTEIGYILGLSVHSVNKSRSEIRRKIVKG